MQKDTRQSTPAPDGGWGWMVVFAAFILNLLNGGVFSVYGILYEEFRLHFEDLSTTGTAWVISIQAGLCYLSGLLTGPFLARWTVRQVTFVGGLMMASGLTATAFAPNAACLYTFFSIITGIGMGFQCLPSSVLVQKYFERHRSVAAAIAVSGGSMGVFIFPPIAQLLMDEYGWRGMVLMASGAVLNSIPMALFLRPLMQQESTIKTSQVNTDQETNCLHAFTTSLRQMFSFSILRKMAPWITIIFWFLTYCGVSGVYTSLTVKCTTLNFPKNYAPFLVSISGITETIGRALSGVVGNFRCVNRIYLFCGSIFISGASSILSGSITSYPLLVVYCAIYGLTIGTFVGLGATIVVDLMGKKSLPHVLGFNFFAGGIGNFIALPLLALSLDISGNYATPFYILGSCFIMAASILLTYNIFEKNRSTSNIEKDYEQTDYVVR